MLISSQTLNNQLWTTLWVALGEVTVFCGSPFQSLEKLCKSSAHWATLCTLVKNIGNFSIFSSVIPVRDLVSFSDALCLGTRQPCGGGHGDPPLETCHFPRLYQEGRHRPSPPNSLLLEGQPHLGTSQAQIPTWSGVLEWVGAPAPS